MWHQVSESISQATSNGRPDIIIRTRWDVVLRDTLSFKFAPESKGLKVQVGETLSMSFCPEHTKCHREVSAQDLDADALITFEKAHR